jgi:reactive intermediate/imine deaminase
LTSLAGAAEVEHFAYPSETALPLSDAVRVGDLLFLSGKLGIRPGERQLVEGGIQPETRQTMENIKAALEKYGSSMTRVIKCTVFLADIAEWSAMNDVYKSYFPTNPPARSALGSSGLALGARVEIECIAALSE